MFVEGVYERLVDQYQSMMFYVAIKIVKDRQLAEDVVQESWIKIFQHLNDNKIEKIGAWLRTITSRTAIDLLRKEKRSKSFMFDDPSLLEEINICATNDVDEHINWTCTVEDLEQYIVKNDKLKSVFDLKFKQELDDHEIAKILNITHSAVKTRIFRARKLIKENYNQNDVGLLKPGA
ncbi:RNA polymerase sigma factor [Gracilibacillus kekensis]|uniref:RNA polymerase sigma-70 factor, ECF subfamily n=1 Tax=Gracilibacillus kekensis TaxID=1027249 RepID=A0A1M7MHZ6_9BACI|nr:sigma-70 family RNA polymerase sigma factor [Gracilibacillus kekensis]SHM90025.1 RNA polymerase sigma-70 factor, ECF subfamily [Gracilibacillus kekensis]